MNDAALQLEWTSCGYAALAVVCLAVLAALFGLVPSLRRRLLPMLRLRPGNWGGMDVLLTFMAYLLMAQLVVSILFSLGTFNKLIGPAPDRETPIEYQAYLNRCVNISSPLILAASLSVIFMYLFLRTGSRPHQYGLSWTRGTANLALGMIAFLIATPLVYAIGFAVAPFFPTNDHGLIQLGKQGIEAWEWALLAFQAVIAAPLLEELVFRGILLGWLRRATLQGHLTLCMMIVFAAIQQADEKKGDWAYAIGFAICMALGYGYLLMRMMKRFGLAEGEIRAWHIAPAAELSESASLQADEIAQQNRRELREQDDRRARLWAETNADLAMLGSAMLFAVVHSNNWPAPVPLMLLGVVLGWLARRTQNLIAPITLHALFNLVAFIGLYGTVSTAGPANGNAQTTPVRSALAASITTSVPASQLPLRK